MRRDKPVSCPHCGRTFTWEYKLKVHLKVRREKGGICPLENRHRNDEKRTCQFCGKALSPAGLGAHLYRRKITGKCPTRKGRTWKKKPEKKRKVSAYMREWNKTQKAAGESWSMLQDVEGMS